MISLQCLLLPLLPLPLLLLQIIIYKEYYPLLFLLTTKRISIISKIIMNIHPIIRKLNMDWIIMIILKVTMIMTMIIIILLILIIIMIIIKIAVMLPFQHPK